LESKVAAASKTSQRRERGSAGTERKPRASQKWRRNTTRNPERIQSNPHPTPMEKIKQAQAEYASTMQQRA
jgi:hypothetical protein